MEGQLREKTNDQSMTDSYEIPLTTSEKNRKHLKLLTEKHSKKNYEWFFFKQL